MIRKNKTQYISLAMALIVSFPITGTAHAQDVKLHCSERTREVFRGETQIYPERTFILIIDRSAATVELQEGQSRNSFALTFDDYVYSYCAAQGTHERSLGVTEDCNGERSMTTILRSDGRFSESFVKPNFLQRREGVCKPYTGPAF